MFVTPWDRCINVGTCALLVYVDDYPCSGPEFQARKFVMQVGEATALEEIEVTKDILGMTVNMITDNRRFLSLFPI